MDRWDPIQLTSSFRPVLEPLETIQATQDQVGLYDGRLKAEEYSNGTVYLTGNRILYIDSKDPVRRSIGLPLRLIHGVQHYGGFMSSSPKLTLELYPRSSIGSQTIPESDASAKITSALGAGLRELSFKSEPSWVCTICYNSNQGGLVKCAICGVRKPAASAEANPLAMPIGDPFLLIEPTQQTTSHNGATQLQTTPASDQPGIACPACTFHNDPFMIQCEICGTQLQDHQSIASVLDRQEQHQRSIRQLPTALNAPSSLSSDRNKSSSSSPSSDVTAVKTSGNGRFLTSMTSFYSGGTSKLSEDANSVKLSFRAGGNSSFHTFLRAALAAKAWEQNLKPLPVQVARTQSSKVATDASPASPLINVGGISGIMRSAETNKKATDETLSQAFQDLQGLMDKAAEMVALAETISNRLAKSNALNNEDTATFKTYLLNMGIAAPVTKDTAGAVFHKELARELAEFVLPIVEREGGTMSLVDVYCVFNRARGVELISPKDLQTACQQFEELSLPLRLRKFDSGLLAIQTVARYSDDDVSSSITTRIQNLPPGTGLTAVELASAIQISIALAQEQLMMTEARGLICRDESMEGLRFYDNLFATYEL
ncbi:hypothetical protein EDD11_004561 [Mortierella claussenii]|nr:hypothetical protein EDD11_004561 [Mortierella claussenii]